MAHPIYTLVTAQRELVGEHPFLGICYSVPVFKKRMIALSQSGMLYFWPCTLEVIALRATSFELSSAMINSCQPSVAADWAMPLLLKVTVSCDIMWCAFIG